MQLDDLSKKYLDLLYKKKYSQIPDLQIQEAKARYSNNNFLIHKPNVTINVSYVDNVIVPLHVYFPKTKPISSIILYFHGGGYVFRNFAQSGQICRQISEDNGSCVVLVEYSLSPEFKYPHAIYEAIHIIEWIMHNELFTSQTSTTPIFIIGESSGANLAIGALLNKQESRLNGIILICPSLDYCNEYQSKLDFKQGFLLDDNVRTWFAKQYLNNESERNDSFVSVLLSSNLHILPKTLIICSYFDPLRDEANAFFDLLIKNGVSSELKTLQTIHGFLNFDIQPYAGLAYDYVSDFISHIV
ncbi:MAG: carboxylesterase (EstA) [uncultured bacterium]|nr:MAG: carboxylesterase (EstA) [uncultured bacterium]